MFSVYAMQKNLAQQQSLQAKAPHAFPAKVDSKSQSEVHTSSLINELKNQYDAKLTNDEIELQKLHAQITDLMSQCKKLQDDFPSLQAHYNKCESLIAQYEKEIKNDELNEKKRKDDADETLKHAERELKKAKEWAKTVDWRESNDPIRLNANNTVTSWKTKVNSARNEASKINLTQFSFDIYKAKDAKQEKLNNVIALKEQYKTQIAKSRQTIPNAVNLLKELNVQYKALSNKVKVQKSAAAQQKLTQIQKGMESEKTKIDAAIEKAKNSIHELETTLDTLQPLMQNELPFYRWVLSEVEKLPEVPGGIVKATELQHLSILKFQDELRAKLAHVQKISTAHREHLAPVLQLEKTSELSNVLAYLNENAQEFECIEDETTQLRLALASIVTKCENDIDLLKRKTSELEELILDNHQHAEKWFKDSSHLQVSINLNGQRSENANGALSNSPELSHSNVSLSDPDSNKGDSNTPPNAEVRIYVNTDEAKKQRELEQEQREKQEKDRQSFLDLLRQQYRQYQTVMEVKKKKEEEQQKEKERLQQQYELQQRREEERRENERQLEEDRKKELQSKMQIARPVYR